MKHVKVVGIALLLFAAALWLRGSAKTVRGDENASTDQSSTAASQVASDPEEARLTAEWVHHLESMDRQRLLLSAASASMTIYREQARAEAVPRWTQVVANNRELYRTLLAKAAKSPRGETECTICDGKSYMTCVMCKNHDGKCITCRGSGHLNQDALCPTCQGAGKCYLCTGSGKMFCPFCNDGMIEVGYRPPSALPPLD